MFSFVISNWQIVFSGVGTAIVAALLAFLIKRRSKVRNIPHQRSTSGAGSQVVQAGRDARVGDFQNNKSAGGN